MEFTYAAVEAFGFEKNVGIYFDMKAQFTDTGLPAQPMPDQTYTVTIHYDQANVPVGVNEIDLALYYLDGSDWVKEPTSIVDTEANTITATPNHFSVWAGIFSTDQFDIFLPILLRE